jgi:hypothetical protein
VSRKRIPSPFTSRVSTLVARHSPSALPPNILRYYLKFLEHSRVIFPARIQPFVQVSPPNSPRINTSKNFAILCISLISSDLKSTRISTSGNKDLKSPRINTSGSKDLKSCRINTSKKQGRGVVDNSEGNNSPILPRSSATPASLCTSRERSPGSSSTATLGCAPFSSAAVKPDCTQARVPVLQNTSPRQMGLNPLESLIVSGAGFTSSPPEHSRWPRLSGFAGRKVSYESYD